METMYGKEFFYPGIIPLCVFPMPMHSGDRELHNHDFYELMIIAKGQATHTVNGKEYPLLPGDIYMIRPGVKHAYHCEEGMAEINVLFDWDKLDINLRDLTAIPGFHALFSIEPAMRKQTDFAARLRLGPEKLRRALDLVADLDQELAQEEPGYQCRAIALFTELIIYLARSYSESENLKAQEIQRIAGAVSTIETRLDQPLTVEELAKKAHCTTKQLREIFNSAYGVSPLAYLTRVRVARAGDLLKETDRPVTDIAFDCGFSDSNYFSRTFKKETGLSPREFRRKYQ